MKKTQSQMPKWTHWIHYRTISHLKPLKPLKILLFLSPQPLHNDTHPAHHKNLSFSWKGEWGKNYSIISLQPLCLAKSKPNSSKKSAKCILTSPKDILYSSKKWLQTANIFIHLIRSILKGQSSNKIK